MHKLIFTEIFADDVKSTIKYIRNTLKAPAAADRLKNEIKKTYKRIRGTPFAFPAVSNDYLAMAGFRFAMVKKFMLFYTVENKSIHIIRLLHGRRDWIHILKGTAPIEE